MKKITSNGIIISAVIVLLLFFGTCKGEPEPDRPSGFNVVKGTSVNGDFSITPTGPQKAGTAITLEPRGAANHLFSEWNLVPDIKPVETPAGSNKWVFNMPPRNVIVNADFLHRDQYPFPLIKGTHTNGNFTINPASTAIYNTPVVLHPTPANDDYKFDSWIVEPNTINILPHMTPGQFYFFMPRSAVTISAKFEHDPTPRIDTGTIAATAPVAGAAAPATGPTATVDTGSSDFTAVLFEIQGGLFDDGKYRRKSVYRFVYDLTPKANFRFVSTANITVPGAVDVSYTFNRSDSARVIATFERTIDWPAMPEAKDVALGKGSAAVASNQSQYNPNAVVANVFDGTSYLLSDSATSVWQASGASVAHWVAIDLGAEYDLGTILITWGAGDGRMWDGMAAGVVQVALAKPDPDEDPEQQADWGTTYYREFMTAGNYSDYGWTSVGTWENTNRGNADPANITGTGNNTRDSTLPWLNRVDLPAGTKGRYIRVKATDPLDRVSPTEGTWTTWPRISLLEVYDRILVGE